MTTKPRLLDLFCGAGGAAMGYHRAGFEVVGVDAKPQPDYPFEFHQADAMTYPLDGFDAIHASPPCQAYTSMRHMGKTAGDGAPDLVDATRARMEGSGLPWIMENVVGSPLRNPLMLCGSMFGLGVDRNGEWQELRRHRLFESSHLLFGLPCDHSGGSTIPVWGDGRPSRREARKARAIAIYGDHPQRTLKDVTYRVNRAHSLAEGQTAMGIDWMPWKTLTQAIPPAYTEWIGRQLMAVVLATNLATHPDNDRQETV